MLFLLLEENENMLLRLGFAGNHDVIPYGSAKIWLI